jgi:hypothetical protein
MRSRRLRWRKVTLTSEGDESRAVIHTPLGVIRIRADQRNPLGRHVVTVDFRPNEGVVADALLHSKLVGMPVEVADPPDPEGDDAYPIVTASGRELSREDVEALAAEAERGYDVPVLRRTDAPGA